VALEPADDADTMVRREAGARSPRPILAPSPAGITPGARADIFARVRLSLRARRRHSSSVCPRLEVFPLDCGAEGEGVADVARRPRIKNDREGFYFPLSFMLSSFVKLCGRRFFQRFGIVQDDAYPLANLTPS